jgi:hypothetical protein
VVISIDPEVIYNIVAGVKLIVAVTPSSPMISLLEEILASMITP